MRIAELCLDFVTDDKQAFLLEIRWRFPISFTLMIGGPSAPGFVYRVNSRHLSG